VVGAAGVERSLTGGALAGAAEVLRDAYFGPAGSAEDGGDVPLGLGPGCGRMIGEGGVAVDTGVVEAAALHADGDDIEGRVVVGAAGLGVEIDSMHSRPMPYHDHRIDDRLSDDDGA